MRRIPLRITLMGDRKFSSIETKFCNTFLKLECCAFNVVFGAMIPKEVLVDRYERAPSFGLDIRHRLNEVRIIQQSPNLWSIQNTRFQLHDASRGQLVHDVFETVALFFKLFQKFAALKQWRRQREAWEAIASQISESGSLASQKLSGRVPVI